MKNRFKRITAIFTILILILSMLAGCAGAKEAADKAAADFVQAAEQANAEIKKVTDKAAEDIENTVKTAEGVVKDALGDSTKQNIRSSFSRAMSESALIQAIADGIQAITGEADGEAGAEAGSESEVYQFTFRNAELLKQHYEKHGKAMGFASPEEYEKAASDVIYNPNAIVKEEAEDGDYCFYVELTNEFVVLSTDGYIRTYFLPDSGKEYFDRQ